MLDKRITNDKQTTYAAIELVDDSADEAQSTYHEATKRFLRHRAV